VNRQVLRHLLIVFGAYFLAMALYPWVQGVQILTHAGDVRYSGLISEILADVITEIPRAIVGVFAAVLIWYAMGPVLARRWMWGLAGLFALFYLLGLRNTRWTPGPDPMRITVTALLPGVACLVAGLVLQRVASSDGPGDEAVGEEAAPRKGRLIVLAVVCGVMPFVVGGVLGMTMATMSSVRDAGPWVEAVFESSAKAKYADTQFQEAKYEAAKVALEDFAGYLERVRPYDSGKPWQPGQHPMLDAKGLAFDRMGTYARLAIIAERAQHADEASAYWARAEEQARVLDWRDPTRETIRHRLAVMMDYNGVKKQPSSPQP